MNAYVTRSQVIRAYERTKKGVKAPVIKKEGKHEKVSHHNDRGKLTIELRLEYPKRYQGAKQRIRGSR
jgi:hypothetical protein